MTLFLFAKGLASMPITLWESVVGTDNEGNDFTFPNHFLQHVLSAQAVPRTATTKEFCRYNDRVYFVFTDSGVDWEAILGQHLLEGYDIDVEILYMADVVSGSFVIDGRFPPSAQLLIDVGFVVEGVVQLSTPAPSRYRGFETPEGGA